MITNYVEKLKQYINENEEISTSDFVEIMGVHTSFLILLLILSVLNIILAPLPINSFILGIPLIFSPFVIYLDSRKLYFQKNFQKNLSSVSHGENIYTKFHIILRKFL